MLLNNLYRNRGNQVLGVRVWNAAKTKQGVVDKLSNSPKGTVATVQWEGGNTTEWEVYDLPLQVVGTEENKPSYDFVEEVELGDETLDLYLRREASRAKMRAPTVRLNYG